jgi:peptide/nickel transport system substrate-binding protein
MVLSGGDNYVQALYLNNAVEPFDNELVRQALCYAIDKYTVIDLAGNGYGFAVGSSMYPAFAKYFDEDLTDYYTYDVEKAKELLAQAGYPDGFSFSITVPASYTIHVSTAQVIAELLRPIGVEVTINTVEYATWYSEAYKGRDYEATIIGVDASTLTASAMLSRFVSDSAKNFINFSSEEYDETYAAAVATVDEAEQTALFTRCQEILTENAASVYIQDATNFVVTQNDIGGYEFYPMYIMDLSTVYRMG